MDAKRQDPSELVFKARTQEQDAVLPRVKVEEKQAWWVWVQEHVQSEIDHHLGVMREAVGEALGVKAREVRCALAAEIDLLRRRLAQLRAEFDADRSIKALHEEVAQARADVPKIPAIEARVAAKQSALERKVAKLERELAVTKDKLASVRVENSELRYGLTLLEKKQLPKPAIQVSLSTPDSSFILKDEDPGALSAWQRFLDCAISSNPDAEASVKGRANGSA